MKNWLILLLTVSIFGLTACGGSKETSDTKPNESETMQKEEVNEMKDDKMKKDEAKNEEKHVVTIATGAVGQELELTKETAKRYMKDNPNVEIKIFETPDSASDRLGLYLQLLEKQSSDVDLFQVDVVWAGDMGGHLLDLNEYGGDKISSTHFSSLIENNTVDGRLVAIPWFIDAGLLFYRSDLLEKYGLDAPETWEDLEKHAKTIQDGERSEGNSDFQGYVWQGNAYEGLTCDALEWIYSNDGGTIISADKKITINNPNAIEAIEMAAAWVGTISPQGVIQYLEEDARNVWQAGNAAFMRNWPYAYALSQEDNSKVQGKFGVSALPAGKSGTKAATLGGWQIGVSKYSKNPEIAADVALYLANSESQKYRAIEGSFNPTITSLYEDAEVIESNPFFKDLYDVFVNSVARPSTVSAPQYGVVSTEFFQAVYSVLNGNTDAETALSDLSDRLEEVTGYEVE